MIMKLKKIISILIIFFVISLVSCTNREKTTTENDLEFIKKYEINVLTINYDIPELDFDKKVTDINNLELTENFNFVLLIEDYSLNLINKEFISSMYTNLHSNTKIIYAFLDFDNYDFFKDTEFANDKDYYPSSTYCQAYTNFYKNQVLNVNLDTGTKDNYWAYVANLLASEIKKVEGSL